MARIRTIKPEFWTSEQIMDCEMVTRLLFIGMWNFADDYGRMPYAPRSIKAQVFPGDNIAPSEIDDRLKELNSKGLILIYSVDDKDYLEITGWKHQKIDRPTAKHPAPFAEDSSNTRRSIDEPSPPEGKGRESKGEETEDAPAADAAHSVSDPPATPEVEFFRRSKQVFGKHGGALGKKLLDAKGGNVALAHAALLTASTKQDPREYLGAIIRGRGDSPEDLRARGEAW
jgi:hypothetical protein